MSLTTPPCPGKLKQSEYCRLPCPKESSSSSCVLVFWLVIAGTCGLALANDEPREGDQHCQPRISSSSTGTREEPCRKLPLLLLLILKEGKIGIWLQSGGCSRKGMLQSRLHGGKNKQEDRLQVSRCRSSIRRALSESVCGIRGLVVFQG